MSQNNKSKENCPARLSLSDVIAAHPAEDPSETKLLRALEEGQEEQQHKSGEFVESLADTPTTSSSNKGTGTVEEELAQLTSSFTDSSDKKGMRGISASKLCKQVSKNLNSFERDAATLVSRASKGQEKAASRGKKNQEGTSDADEKAEGKDLMILNEFQAYASDRKHTFWANLKSFCLYSMLPFGGMSAFLFYVFPETANVEDSENASVSWWLMFIGVRQVFTLLLAKLAEAILIDFLAVQTRVSLRIIGPFFTLMLVQSKGWTFQLFAWASIDFTILYGSSDFAHHWLYFLDGTISLFSEKNASGNVVESQNYRDLLFTALFVSAAIAVKRFFLGLWYGRSVYRRYGQELVDLMTKVRLIQKIAALAKDKQGIQKGRLLHVPSKYAVTPEMDDNENEELKRVDTVDSMHSALSASKLIIDTSDRDRYAGGELRVQQKQKIQELLGEWEEPITHVPKEEEEASISAVVNFRAAMSVIQQGYPFSVMFGRARTRVECIDSAQRLFLRLEALDGNQDNLLKFDLLAAVALNKSQELDEVVLKSLIELFRPIRDGELTILDFVKSIDSVYKELRILEASVMNADRMNAASQEIFDAFYHTAVLTIALTMLGVNAFAVFGSFTAFIVGFAFMIGGATSNWFEGMLFMLVRKPYDIGDRIAVSSPDDEVSFNGSAGWIVKDVNLYYTTVIFGTTMEEATYSNFSLSDLRVINHNRSPKAFLNFAVRVGISTPKETIHRFAEAVKEYVKDRPREWLSFTAFRLTDVQVDLGYAEYRIFMQHRESWQQIGAVLSRADVQMYAYELSKELGMNYESPPTPIILRNEAEAAVISAANVSNSS